MVEKVYEVLTGIEWVTPSGTVRVESGYCAPDPDNDVPEIPEASVPWLLECGAIRVRKAKTSKRREG